MPTLCLGADMSEGLASTPATGAATEQSGAPVRLGAKALVSSSDRVLLVRERHADGRPFWTLPGGGVEPSESLIDALRRELREELRAECVVGGVTSAFWYAHRSPSRPASIYTVFACSLLSPARPVGREGILAARWVDPDRPPAGTLLQVRRVLEDHVPCKRPR
jgi:8-oxo-dGTP diphosphatase